MAIFSVSVYTRTTENGKRRYEQADHRKAYADGTIFSGTKWLESASGKLSPAICSRTSVHCAAPSCGKLTLLMGAINTAKNAPVVPVVKEPAKPARLTVAQAIDRYLQNASTLSPRTYQGYTYTLNQFRQSCSKQFLDEINKQDLYDLVTFLRTKGGTVLATTKSRKWWDYCGTTTSRTSPSR